MVSRVVDHYRPDRFERAFPCATGGLSRCERHPRWQGSGREPVSGRRENARSSSTVDMPRHIDRRLPCAAGVVPPAPRLPDFPQPLATLQSPPATPLGRPPRLEHIAGATVLVPWLTTASIRSPGRPSQFSALPRCLPPPQPCGLSPETPTPEPRH